MGWSNREHLRLMGRLYLYYMLALAAGTAFIFLNNVILHGKPWSVQLLFHVPFLIVSDVVFAWLLLGISYLRLSSFLRFLRTGGREGSSMELFRRLTRFPVELSLGMLILAIMFMAAFHISEAVYEGEQPEVYALADSILSELSLTLVLSILLYSLVRFQLRPYIRLLRMEALGDFESRSLIFSILYTSAGCLSFTIASSIRYVVSREQSGVPFDWMGFSWFTGIYAVFGIGIFSFHLLDLRRQLRSLIQSIHSLYRGSKEGMHLPVPLVSPDETGKLADAFNALQRKVSSTYEQVEQQMKLASGIQQELLPKRELHMQEVSVAAVCRQSREVGGDFYDCVQLGDNRLAVAIGDVSGKGLPAALLMSAVMMGLRTEAEVGGSAGDILTRLNRNVHAMTQGKLYVTIGLAIFERSAHCVTVEYSSAGHLEPYLLRAGQAVEWPCSSLPMGMDPEVCYRSEVGEMDAGDALVLYTDGVVEAGASSGSMLGFDGWMQMLEQFAADYGNGLKDAEQGLADLIGGLPEAVTGEDSEHEETKDDRTVVLILSKPERL